MGGVKKSDDSAWRCDMPIRIEFRFSIANKPGTLWQVCCELHKQNINIKTIAGIAGYIAMITDHDEKTRNTLKNLNIRFKEYSLLTLKVRDRPGEIAFFIKKLSDADINIDSIYLISKAQDQGEIALSVDDLERARMVLGL
jgi:hypothetical protein